MDEKDLEKGNEKDIIYEIPDIEIPEVNEARAAYCAI